MTSMLGGALGTLVHHGQAGKACVLAPTTENFFFLESGSFSTLLPLARASRGAPTSRQLKPSSVRTHSHY
jgi:hypothetical protein